MKLPRYRTIDDLEHGIDSAPHTAQQRDKDNRNNKPYRAWLYDNGAPSISALAILIRKGLERSRPERTCAYHGLPHSGRSFFGDTHRTHPSNRSCRRMPRFPPCHWQEALNRERNLQPPRDRPHMDTGRGQTNRSPVTLRAAVGNFVRKPCAVKKLN